MLCNVCEHRRQNIEAKQNGLSYIPQPRMECGSAGSVCGCYMFKPSALPVMKAADGDRRPVGGPPMIAARIHATGYAEDTGVFRVPVGPKKNKEFVFIRRPLLRNELQAIKQAKKKEDRERAKWLRDMRKTSHNHKGKGT